MINIRVEESKHVNGEYSMFITFPYDSKIVSVIRGFSNRYWDKANTEWELPLAKLGEFVNSLKEYEISLYGKYVSLTKPEAKIPEGFEFKTKPFEHQIEGFNYGLQNNRWLLGDEQGLGKTKQVIDIAVAKKLQYNYKHCLIICGVNGLKWNWQNEIKTHSNETGFILGQRYNSKGKVSVKSNKEKLEDLKALSDNSESISSYFLITNVETLRDEKIASEIANLCERDIINIVAIDEIHKCKNPASQQGKGILKIQPSCRIAMTGTPLMNNPFDLYIILKWLGYERHGFFAFKKHYATFGGYGGYEVVGYKNLNELQEQLDNMMLRRLKDEVLDLPEKLHINEYVEMSSKQAQIYREVTNSIKANIDQIKMSSNPLAELIRLRQATGFTGILSSTVKESAKLDRMEELVEEAVQNGKKVVIFSNWTQMTDAISERILKMGYAPLIITGETKDEDRQACVEMFQNRDNNPVIIGTIGAMGTGLTLTSGSVEIFMDEPWTMAAKAQAEDRCHRIGQKSNVTIYTLMCKDTIDERIHDIVEQKGFMSDAIVDGKIVAGKENMLEFLLS